MRVFKEIRSISSGRDERLVHPLRFKKASLFIFTIPLGSSLSIVQPSRFNLSRDSAFDKADKSVNSVE